MLTYDFSSARRPFYAYLYDCIKKDISSGRLSSGQKMPSKRSLAKNLGVSAITVENAYAQLAAEGYVRSIPRRGFFVADMAEFPIAKSGSRKKSVSRGVQCPKQKSPPRFDFSSNDTPPETFPFSVWARLMRGVISEKKDEALLNITCGGCREVRASIAGHLASFRGMKVDPDQIILGAGTEYLYGLLIQLLGDKKFCLENPGYKKIARIYESHGARFGYAKMDRDGILVSELLRISAQAAHISPTHHFPTGITMGAKRRAELLKWASEEDGRFIIEDDYDSEFRIKGRPIPPLQTQDANGKVIYMNTFSKSLARAVRISYMVLPPSLASDFYRRLSFYTCTVSNFEQYTLARFISEGYFEKHINRMRLLYGRKRKEALEAVPRVFKAGECEIIENDSGLHFILKLNMKKSDDEFEEALLKKRIRLAPLKNFFAEDESTALSERGQYERQFIVNYSNLKTERLEEALRAVRAAAFR